MIVAARKLVVGLLVVVLLTLVGSVVLSGSASAHVRSTEGTSVIRQVGSTVRIVTTLEYDVLAAAAGLGLPPASTPARAALLVDRHDQLASYLTDRITVSIDGVACEGRLTGAGVETRQDKTYARSTLRYDCPGSPEGDYVVRYDIFSTEDAIVDNHTNIADYQLGGAGGTFVFDQAHREFETGHTGLTAAVSRFVAIGVEHILSGADHVLFLAVLLIGASGFASVLKIATSFTVAHSVTLALGVLGLVSVPGKIVEPLIALSIAYVAAENIIGGESRHRLAVVFGFGLLHGLGFASSLSFTEGLSSRLIGSLVSFNAGIEIGQLAIIGLLFPVLLFVRRRAWSGFAHTVATAGAAVVSLVWFVQRLFF